jgi:uncharacterized membrane protein
MSDPAPRVLAVAAPGVLTDTASDTLRGIGFVVVAYFLLTVGDVATKLVLPEAGVAGAMIGRGVFGALGIAGLALAQPVPQPWRMLLPKRWGMVLLRAALSAFVSLTWYIAWRTMSLPDTYAIGFTVPLLMTLMAIPMLGERIRWALVHFHGLKDNDRLPPSFSLSPRCRTNTTPTAVTISPRWRSRLRTGRSMKRGRAGVAA